MRWETELEPAASTRPSLQTKSVEAALKVMEGTVQAIRCHGWGGGVVKLDQEQTDKLSSAARIARGGWKSSDSPRSSAVVMFEDELIDEGKKSSSRPSCVP